jgi:hypothetical protein
VSQPQDEEGDGKRYENHPKQHTKPYYHFAELRLLFLLAPALRFLDSAAFWLTLWGMVSSHRDLLSERSHFKQLECTYVVNR